MVLGSLFFAFVFAFVFVFVFVFVFAFVLASARPSTQKSGLITQLYSLIKRTAIIKE
jgi:hypothetical protein